MIDPTVLGTITRLEMAQRCHWLTVVDEEGNEHHGCTGDAYPLVLITYSVAVEEIFGKQVRFRLDENGRIRETRSIEGYDAREILDVMENRTSFLDPASGSVPGFTHHIVRKHNERVKRKCDKRTNLLTGVPGLGPSMLHFYFVVDHGFFETATVVWLGPWPKSLPVPTTDADTITTVAHLLAMGGIARENLLPAKRQELPALVCSR